ncbi:hypothetical protein D9M68_933240 [compost metagenome]
MRRMFSLVDQSSDRLAVSRLSTMASRLLLKVAACGRAALQSRPFSCIRTEASIASVRLIASAARPVVPCTRSISERFASSCICRLMPRLVRKRSRLPSSLRVLPICS